VVLPTCNRLSLLRTTVASVLAQTFREWELVIADDGSDADTRAYLSELARDPRVRVQWLPHSGIPAVVRNAGLRAARGEYIAFLDSDDVWARDKLARQLDTLRTHSACHWSYTGSREIDATGREIDDRYCMLPARPLFDALVSGPTPVRASSVVLASRALLRRAGGFDPTLASSEDNDLWLRLSQLSEVVILDEPLVQIRRHALSHSRHWDIAFAGRELSLWKLEKHCVDPDQRQLLRRERTRNALQLAAAHAAQRDSRRMWQALLGSAPYSWAYVSWWLGLMREPLRAHLPPQLLAACRRWRASRR
jgi:GT2 family glycosyltransferase